MDTELAETVLGCHPRIGDIDAAAWNRLAGASAFADHGFLETVESYCRAPIEPLYFTAHRAGVLIATSACHIVWPKAGIESVDQLVFGRMARPANVAGVSFLPAMVCGPALGYGWHMGIDPDLGPRDADTTRLVMLEAIEAEARARGLSVSVTQLLDDERELSAHLAARRYLRCRNVPVAVLDLPFASFDKYLDRLPRKIRAECRRQINRNRESGTVVELLDTVGDLEGRLQELVDQNSLKHNGLPFALGPGFFSGLQRHLGDRVRIFVARKSGTVTGVCVMLIQHDAAWPIVVGVDARMAADDYTYFQVTYHAPIAHAIAFGVRRMYYGRGLEDIKARRGCRFTETWTYSRPGSARRAVTAAWFLGASAWNRFKLSSRVRAAITGPET